MELKNHRQLGVSFLVEAWARVNTLEKALFMEQMLRDSKLELARQKKNTKE